MRLSRDISLQCKIRVMVVDSRSTSIISHVWEGLSRELLMSKQAMHIAYVG